ncbi:ParB/RepB/Spo0J family partition protein [Streptomyces sp. NPDC050856]|uniref:ParB/RepB/Spo0J family partition protein n=1 Tax=Streptomyces sp. NPDC050856 TaxID=3154939 RepID=UPI0033EF3D57
MKAADRLGTGVSFGNVPRGRSARGRAKAIAQGDMPTYELVRLRLSDVAPTPLNPRRNFGTDEELTRFGEELRSAQLAACVAVTRPKYLTLWPDHADHIGDAEYVLINGERRYRSAEHVGLEALDFVVRDDLASSREGFIDHLLKENLEREDFDVIERARGVQQLVNVCAEESEKGARTRAAERLGKDRSWVTNQLALLELPDEIQAMLSSGDMPERDGRALARHRREHPELDAAGLITHLKETKEKEAQAKAQEKAILQAVRQKAVDSRPALALPTDNGSEPSGTTPPDENALSADNEGDSPGTPLRTGAAALSRDNNEPSSRASTDGPQEQKSSVLSADNTKRSEQEHNSDGPLSTDNDSLVASANAHSKEPGGQETSLPWDDPQAVFETLMQNMRRAHRVELTRLLISAHKPPAP